MNLRKAAEQALEALETEPESYADWLRTMRAARTALRAALSEDVPEIRFGNMTQGVDLPPLPSPDYYDPYDEETPFFSEEQMRAYAAAIIAALRAALEPVASCHELSKEGDKLSLPFNHFADAGKMVATINKMETVEPVAWMRSDRGHVDFHRHPDYLPLYTTAPPGIVARAVAVERERIAAWVEDMCVGLDANTIAEAIRNGGNDDIRAFEVRK